MIIKAQRGVGLIELMIAVTIGMLLTVGLTYAFVAMKNTSTLRQQMSTVQNAERMAAMILQTSVRNAGYRPDATVALNTQFLAAASTNNSGDFAAGQVVSGTGTGAAGADTISVRFVAESSSGNGTGAVTDQGCTPQLTVGNNYTDVFSVTGGNLVCTEINSTANTTATVTLLGGLAGMNVQYGVDTDSGGSQDQYFTGANSMTPSYWSTLKTVNVTFLFTNPLAGQPGQASTVSFSQMVPYMVGL